MRVRIAATLVTAYVIALPARAAEPDPTVDQIYQAVVAHQYEKAQALMDQVLRDHPNSAKAHYVQAEIFAKQGKNAEARSELERAEKIDPALSHVNPRSVLELRAQLGVGDAHSAMIRIPLASRGGTLIAPVVINDAIKLDFLVDSGASDVTIPADVFSTLVRTGTISRSDMRGSQRYQTATGEVHESDTFIIKSLKVGDVRVTDVKASVAPAKGPLLLGQSFLRRFKNWSVDNATRELILER
jgi:clan AA aspartic protease (TIGR02281 family)